MLGRPTSAAAAARAAAATCRLIKQHASHPAALLSWPPTPKLYLLVRRPAAAAASSLPQTQPQQNQQPQQHPTRTQPPPSPVAHKLTKHVKCEFHAVEPSLVRPDTLWLPVYRMPKLHYVHLFARFKLYLSAASGLGCLSLLYKWLLHHQDPHLLTHAAFLGSVSLAGLIATGASSRLIVSAIYVTQDGTLVRLSRHTFFGHRLDMILPKDCLLPLTETNINGRKFWLKLKTNSPDTVDTTNDEHEFYDQSFYITLVYGGVLDYDRFNDIAGRIIKH